MTDEKNTTNTINKDELMGIARNIECATVMMGDILGDYFEALDRDDKQDQVKILWDFNRYRKYVYSCFDLLLHAENELHEKGIDCYK